MPVNLPLETPVLDSQVPNEGREGRVRHGPDIVVLCLQNSPRCLLNLLPEPLGLRLNLQPQGVFRRLGLGIAGGGLCPSHDCRADLLSPESEFDPCDNRLERE